VLDAHRTATTSSSPARQASSNTNRFVFVGPAHVTAPFRFPQYYGAQEWLSFVTDEHIKAYLGVHGADGALLRRHELRSLAHHTSLDLVALELLDEPHFVRQSEQNGAELRVATLDDGDDSTDVGALECVGHLQLDGDVTTTASSTATADVMQPTMISGAFEREFQGRSFVRTERVLERGMCGGPVVHRASPRLVGLVEAVVSSGSGPVGEQLRGCAAIIGRKQLIEFLKDV